jgi:hypothetical protein
MDYYESNLEYDEQGHLNEQRDFQKYYNTPMEVDGIWFASIAQFEECYRIKEMEDARCKRMSVDLMSFIKQMLLDAKVKEMVNSLDEFPPLKKTQ